MNELKINKKQAYNSDLPFVLPSRMDLLSFIARDSKAGCQKEAREYLAAERDWFTEMTFQGKITDPDEWGRRG